MTLHRRSFAAVVLSSLQAFAGPASAAGNRSVAYVSPYPAYPTAYLIDWQGASRAHVVAALGNGDGSVTLSGNQRVIRLKRPFSQQYQNFDVFDDCLQDYPFVQQDTLQVAVNSLTGNDKPGHVGRH
jgi:hypothetical protein